MSFTTKLTFENGLEPGKTLIVDKDDKHVISLGILGPNGQQTTFRVDASDLLVGLRAFFPDYIKLSE